MFVLQYYIRPNPDRIPIVDLLSAKDSSIDTNILHKCIETLENERFIFKNDNQYYTTPKGYIVANMRGEFSNAHFDYLLCYIQAPAI